MERRRAVELLADKMEERFAEFDGERRMASDDTATASIRRAQCHLQVARTIVTKGSPEDYRILMERLVDSANRIALAIHVLEHGLTDEGVND